jgi:hypothetical protein
MTLTTRVLTVFGLVYVYVYMTIQLRKPVDVNRVALKPSAPFNILWFPPKVRRSFERQIHFILCSFAWAT